jgi:hypothetical protein
MRMSHQLDQIPEQPLLPGKAMPCGAYLFMKCRKRYQDRAGSKHLTICCRLWNDSLPGYGRRWCERLRQAVSDGRGEHHWPADIGFDPEGLTIGTDGDSTMFIGAKDLGTQSRIALDHGGVWMSEAIIALYRKHGDTRVNGAHEGRSAGRPTAVMGWFYRRTMTRISLI